MFLEMKVISNEPPILDVTSTSVSSSLISVTFILVVLLMTEYLAYIGLYWTTNHLITKVHVQNPHIQK